MESIRQITVMLHNEPLQVRLCEDEYRAWSRQEVLERLSAEDARREADWKRALAEINGPVPPPTKFRARTIAGYGCSLWIAVGALLGALTMLLMHH